MIKHLKEPQITYIELLSKVRKKKRAQDVFTALSTMNHQMCIAFSGQKARLLDQRHLLVVCSILI